MRKYVLYILVFTVGLLTLASCPTVFIDEFWIGEGVNSIVKTGTYRIDSFRNSIVYNINGYPLYSILQAICVKIFSYSLFSLRLVSLLSMMFTTICTVGFIKNITQKEVEWYWILCIVFNPLFWHSGHLARPEALTISVLAASMYIVSIDFRSYKYAILAGLVAGLGIYVHIPGIYTVLVACSISFFGLLLASKRWNWQPFAVGLGALFTIILYFIFINTPQDLKTFLSGEVVVVANRKEGSLLRILTTYPLLYFKYFIRNIILYLPIIISVIACILVYKKELVRKLYSYGMVLLTALLVVLFFMILGRSSRLYFINIEYWIILLAVILYTTSAKTHQLIKYTGYFTLFMWVFHIVFYTIYYPKSDYDSTKSKILEIPHINQNTVLARIQYQGIFADNKQFLAFEDYKYLYDFTNRKDLVQYIIKNQVQYIIVDKECEKYKFLPILQAFLSQNAQLVASLDNTSIASREYDGFPFEWSYSDVFKSPKNYKIQIYSVVK